MLSISGFEGCENKIQQSTIHWTSYKFFKKAFLSIVKAGNSEIEAPEENLFGEGLFTDSSGSIFLLCAHATWQGSSLGSVYKGIL